MMLLPIQRKVLAKYRAYRDRPVSFARQLAAMIPLVFAFCGFGAVAYYFVHPGLALFVAGLGLGSVLRQGALTWQARRVMPVLVAVIDWAKVDHLLRDNEIA